MANLICLNSVSQWEREQGRYAIGYSYLTASYLFNENDIIIAKMSYS